MDHRLPWDRSWTRILFALFARSSKRGQLCSKYWSEHCGRPRGVFIMCRSPVRNGDATKSTGTCPTSLLKTSCLSCKVGRPSLSDRVRLTEAHGVAVGSPS